MVTHSALYLEASKPGVESDDEGRTGASCCVAIKDLAMVAGRAAPSRADLSAFRYLTNSVLSLEATLRYARRGRTGRSPTHAPPIATATAREVVSKILYLRQRYHFGPGRIASYLKRFHEVTIACSSVHRILGKHGMSRLPANQKHQPHQKRWKRYEKPQPGHRLQMDVKFLERIPGTGRRLYQFTAIDDCTRIRVLKVRRVQSALGNPVPQRSPATASVPNPRRPDR